MVDESSHSILGRILVFKKINELGKNKFKKLKNYNNFSFLKHLINSSNIWEQRIALICSFVFLKEENLLIPISLCQKQMENSNHYIQKAVGWVLREIGKKDKDLLNWFLTKNIDKISSVTLSYSLEKHSFEEKKKIKDLKFKKYQFKCVN